MQIVWNGVFDMEKAKDDAAARGLNRRKYFEFLDREFGPEGRSMEPDATYSYYRSLLIEPCYWQP